MKCVSNVTDFFNRKSWKFPTDEIRFPGKNDVKDFLKMENICFNNVKFKYKGNDINFSDRRLDISPQTDNYILCILCHWIYWKYSSEPLMNIVPKLPTLASVQVRLTFKNVIQWIAEAAPFVILTEINSQLIIIHFSSSSPWSKWRKEINPRMELVKYCWASFRQWPGGGSFWQKGLFV